MLARLRRFALFFFAQAANYGFLCWNYRAVAGAHYLHIALSDIGCASLTFLLIRHVSRAESGWEFWGYVAGGVAGSLASVWFTSTFLGV